MAPACPCLPSVVNAPVGGANEHYGTAVLGGLIFKGRNAVLRILAESAISMGVQADRDNARNKNPGYWRILTEKKVPLGPGVFFNSKRSIAAKRSLSLVKP